MIRIVTDSTSDLSADRAAALGVEVLPLSVHFGEESFQDGVDITKEEFYARLEQAETLPTTAQIPPETFIKTFERLTAQGDQVLGIFLSSAMSGTYQSAMIARDIVGEERIAVVDSQTVTFALGLLVEAACLLRDQGLSLEELRAQVEALAGRVRLLAVVDTLKYLKMGGRISGAAAVVGGLGHQPHHLHPGRPGGLGGQGPGTKSRFPVHLQMDRGEGGDRYLPARLLRQYQRAPGAGRLHGLLCGQDHGGHGAPKRYRRGGGHPRGPRRGGHRLFYPGSVSPAGPSV